MKHIPFITLFAWFNLFSLAQAAEVFPFPLIKADWLSANIDNVVILDVRKELDTFRKEGHIENAILVDDNTVRVKREIEGKLLTRMRPDAEGFQAFMRQHGIDNDSHVVITHRGKTPGQVAGAARLYWQMKYYSFQDVALLDGGNAAWVAALEDLSDEASESTVGDYTVGAEQPEILATMQQVQAALDNPAITLVDTRELRAHIGIDKKDYVYAAGHIPGSRNLPYKLFHPAKGNALYFPADKLHSIIQALRIEPKNELILYCNSAYECSSDWFVLHEILGYQRVRIYDGSLHQWTQYKDNPMTTILTH